MNKSWIEEQLAARYTLNKQKINNYKSQRNVDGTYISKGHASTALSNTRKEQNIIELLVEILAQVRIPDIKLSSNAVAGLNKIIEPQQRHFKGNQYGGVNIPINIILMEKSDEKDNNDSSR